MKKIPYLAIGNDELKNKPLVHEGDKIYCQRCHNRHSLKCALENGEKTEMLLFYNCRKKSYLAAINNKLII